MRAYSLLFATILLALLLGVFACSSDSTDPGGSDSDTDVNGDADPQIDGDNETDIESEQDTDDVIPSDGDTTDADLDFDSVWEMEVEEVETDDVIDGDLDLPDAEEQGDEFDIEWEPDTEFEEDIEPDIEPDMGQPVEIRNFFLVQNPANSLSYYVEWETDLAVATHLQVRCGDDYSRSFDDDTAKTHHQVFVMGLYDEAECEFKAQAGSSFSVQLATAGPLPENVPVFTIDTLDASKIQSGWTLFNQNDEVNKSPLLIVIVDELGRIRWYHRRAIRHQGADTDVRTIEQGILIGGNRNVFPPAIVDWEGQVLWEEDLFVHHDIRTYGEGKLIYLTTYYDCPGDLEPYFAGGVREYDMTLRQDIWSWNICEHYRPDVLKTDWSHVNTVEPFPNEDAFLVSSRNQYTLFKVDHATGNVIWKLGEHGDFDIPEADRFYRQHAPEILPNGNILIFDNGDYNIREYSRAVELHYDTQSMQAQAVWSYRPDPDIFCPAYGDADRLDNGNTLITFGKNKPGQISRLIEVTATGEKVWQLSTGFSIYRAERLKQEISGYILANP